MASLHDIVSNDLNYEIWAPIVKATLVEKELWNVVEYEIPPDPSKIPALSASIQPEELSIWREVAGKDTKALQIIQSSLPESVFRKTLEVTSAKDLWDLLKESNEQKEEANLVNEFEEAKIEERESIPFPFSAEAISGFVGITKLVVGMSDSYYGAGIIPAMDKLVVVEKPTFVYLRELLDTFESKPVKIGCPPDDEFVTRMMVSMSDRHYGAGKPAVTEEELVVPQILSFKGFREVIDIIETRPVETINMILKGFESMPPSSQLEEDSSSKSRRKIGECLVCGGIGHFAKDCRKIKNQPRTQVQVPEHKSLAMYVGGLTYDENMWTVFSSTTNHMTPYERLFTTLDRTRIARVTFIDGSTRMAKGTGDVTVLNKEGKRTTIKDVLFVPGIVVNVISVGQMCRSGYDVEMNAERVTIRDRKTRKLFGETKWEERGFVLRLQWFKPQGERC